MLLGFLFSVHQLLKCHNCFPVGRPQLITQSNAILRYTGRLGGLYPEDLLDSLRLDEVLGGLEDIIVLLTPSIKEQVPCVRTRGVSSVFCWPEPFCPHRNSVQQGIPHALPFHSH